MLGFLLVVIGGLYWISVFARQNKIQGIEAMNHGVGYSKGIITDFHSYKGHTLTVSYKLNGRSYEYDGGWDRNPKRLNKGDSISFKYARSNPEMILTELNDDY